MRILTDVNCFKVLFVDEGDEVGDVQETIVVLVGIF